MVSWRRAGLSRALDLFGARRPVALVAWALLVVVLGVKGGEASDAGWIAEKFRSWSDQPISRDDVLTNVSLYWFSGAIGSSFWPYYARAHRGWPIPEGGTVGVRVGYAEFPKEILRPPRSLAEQTYTRIERWTRMEQGGHFAALEQPHALASEVLKFF